MDAKAGIITETTNKKPIQKKSNRLKRGDLQSRARVAGGKRDAKCSSKSGRAADADMT